MRTARALSIPSEVMVGAQVLPSGARARARISRARAPTPRRTAGADVEQSSRRGSGMLESNTIVFLLVGAIVAAEAAVFGVGRLAGSRWGRRSLLLGAALLP